MSCYLLLRHNPILFPHVPDILAQSELIEIDRQMAEWIPPPVTLSESDLELVEKEAKSAVQSMRAGDDEAHATRIQSLRETLETIRDGGAARLQAEKDAAAVMLRNLSPSNTLFMYIIVYLFKQP